MKPLKITINYSAQDGYLYGGRLFLVCNDGSIKAISLWKLISHNIDYFSNDYNIIKLAFDRNNWLNNSQADAILGVSEMKTQFKKAWDKISKIEYHFEINEEDLTTLAEINSLPIFDFKLYGMRMLIGNREGLHEAGVSLKGDNEVRLNEKIHRVFDARTTSINGKSGSIMVSSNSDGLFHGRLNEINKRIKVYVRPVKKKSLRTGWTGYDLINYNNQKDFDYLKNSYSKDEERKYLYSSTDEDSRKIRINKIGEEEITMSDLFERTKINIDDIIYSFNSTKSCFLFLKDGRFVNSYFNKYYGPNNNIKLRSVLHDLPKKLSGKKVNRPISSHIVPKGCVIEFFDEVFLVQNGKKVLLEDKGITSIRTYPNSIRYRNLITTFDGEEINIHSIFPS